MGLRVDLIRSRGDPRLTRVLQSYATRTARPGDPSPTWACSLEAALEREERLREALDRIVYLTNRISEDAQRDLNDISLVARQALQQETTE